MILHLIYGLLGNVAALLIANQLLESLYFEGGYLAPVIVAFVLIVINTFIKPVLKILSLPLIFMSGGLILIVLNGAIFYAADRIVEKINFQGVDMVVSNNLTYLYAAVIFGLANWGIHLVLRD